MLLSVPGLKLSGTCVTPVASRLGKVVKSFDWTGRSHLTPPVSKEKPVIPMQRSLKGRKTRDLMEDSSRVLPVGPKSPPDRKGLLRFRLL